VSAPLRRLTESTARQQQTQRTLLDWLRVEYGIEKPSNKFLARADLDSNTWLSEIKRIRGKKHRVASAIVCDGVSTAPVVFAPEYGNEDDHQIGSHICNRD